MVHRQVIVDRERRPVDLGGIVARRIVIDDVITVVEVPEGSADGGGRGEKPRRGDAADAGRIERVCGAAGRVDMRIISDEVRFQAIGGLPLYAPAKAILVDVVDLGPGQIFLIPVASGSPDRKAGGNVLGDPAADIAADRAILVVSGPHGHHRLEVLARLPRGDVDGAYRRVATVERALGPPQNFHGGDVLEVALDRARGHDVDTVNEDSDAGLDARVGARRPDAADEYGRVPVVVRLGDVHRGNEAREFGDVANSGLLKIVAAHGGNRHRNILDVFSPLVGRHDQGFDFHCLVGRLGGRCRRERGDQRHGRTGKQVCAHCSIGHRFSPI